MILLSFLFMLAGYLFLILAFAELCSIWAEIPEEIDYYEGYEPAPGEGEDPWEGVDPEERQELYELSLVEAHPCLAPGETWGEFWGVPKE